MKDFFPASDRRGFIASTALSFAGAATALPFMRPATAATTAEIGAWSQIYTWPDVAIHLTLLPNGRVLSYSDDDAPFKERNADFSKAFVVEIPAGKPPSAVVVSVPNKVTNLFCSGHAFMPDGRLLVTGGHAGKDNYGEPDATFFTAASGGYTWTRTNTPMNDGRWYSTALTLANGEVLVLGGTRGTNNHNKLPQVWRTNAGGGWRDLDGAELQVPTYPRIHLAPNGRVFMSGVGRNTRFLNTAGRGAWTTGPARLGGYRDYGTSVMYDDGKVLALGGGNPPTSNAEVIDLRAAKPAWRWTASMRWARRHLNATILPDGKVLASGGSSVAGNDAAGAVLPAELWDPATGKWTTMASMRVPRIYHSTALLLPDGRVLSAGGGRPQAKSGGVNNENAEIYSPPYLFKGARPVIGSAPTRAGYGRTFTVGTAAPAQIAQVTLVRLGSVTHAVNMNQHFKRLAFAPATGGLAVTLPSDRNLLPPGHYMLFILNRSGVPSVARIIQVA